MRRWVDVLLSLPALGRDRTVGRHQQVSSISSPVMAVLGLDPRIIPAIHVFAPIVKVMDGWTRSGHDAWVFLKRASRPS
jgi:hypothetical protein